MAQEVYCRCSRNLNKKDHEIEVLSMSMSLIFIVKYVICVALINLDDNVYGDMSY